MLRTCCRLQLLDLLQIRTQIPYVIRSIYRFVAVICFVIGCSATRAPQQIEIQTTLLDCCGFVDLWASVCCATSRFVEMSWICCRLSIRCIFVVDFVADFVAQLVVQQIHNKSNK